MSDLEIPISDKISNSRGTNGVLWKVILLYYFLYETSGEFLSYTEASAQELGAVFKISWTEDSATVVSSAETQDLTLFVSDFKGNQYQLPA